MIHWNISPDLVTIGFLTIRWYGILFAAAFIFGFLIMRRVYDKEGRPRAELDILLLYVLAGAIIGARLGHCLFYDPKYYLNNPVEFLKVWEGGLASHGGAVGILVSLVWFNRRSGNFTCLQLLDRIVIPAALGGLFIRVGNFFNSEIVGTPTDGSWGVVFERIDMIPRHPVQLYEAVAYGMVFLFLLLAYGRYRFRLREGTLTGIFLVMVFLLRFVLEFVKMPQAGYEAGILISVGQWLSIPFVIAGFFLLARALRENGPSD